MYELIIFDWDGTLVDSKERIGLSMQRAAKDAGQPVPSLEAVYPYIGLGLPEVIEALFPDADAVLHQSIKTFYSHHFFELDQQPAVLFAHAEETLGLLRERGYRLAVATGKSRRGLNRGFDKTGWRCFFESSRCADETTSKPDPRMLNEILGELGVAPERALMVGDTSFDLQMAELAGMDAVGVSYGVHPLERLQSANPVKMIHSLRELSDWLITGKEFV
ncbi:HAD-IA family hydrolase [Pokkaliibacter sp. CJK22405]|uniref:HAD-IA family hydrolase n=1 Tax=Pokkaliibacter sp. CJK22405 TaxID=3384615 RepID=UPI0039846386